jgi:MoaA/NifB/PqqE/SkfB family radical SAM enzyme
MFKTEDLLKLNRFVGSNRLKFFLIYLADMLGLRHIIIRFDPVTGCNLRCRMCYFSNEQWRKEHTGKRFNSEEIERIAAQFFPLALQLYIGCGMEPTVYKGYEEIVALAKRYNIPFVSLVSNGQLLDVKNIEKLVEFGLDEITLSVHGVNKGTYEQFMVNASYDKFIQVLGTLKKIKEQRNTAKPRLRLNYTVNRDNLEELTRFYDAYGKYGISVLQIRPMIDLGTETCREKRLNGVVKRYEQILDVLKEESRRQNVRLLYNDVDPTYAKGNVYAAAYTIGAMRYVGPERVWEDGYDWRNLDYRTYSKQSGFRRKLLRYALGKAPIPEEKTALASSQIL